MKTLTTPTQSLPFKVGEPRSFGGLTILPLYPQSSSVEYIDLDEAVARGLEILEVDEHGVVPTHPRLVAVVAVEAASIEPSKSGWRRSRRSRVS
jgi:hypothetical protein